MDVDQRKRLGEILLAAAAAAAFAWAAVRRRSGASLNFDLAVRGRVHAWASPAMTAIARVLATVGSPVVLPFVFGIAILVFHRQHWARAAITLAAVMGGAIICNVGLKRLIQSPRPEPFFGTEPSSYSFPSGHALYSLSFYGVIAGVLSTHAPAGAARIGIWIGATLLIWGIGLSRVYLGVHYASDVIAGYLAAVFVISLVSAAWPG